MYFTTTVTSFLFATKLPYLNVNRCVSFTSNIIELYTVGSGSVPPQPSHDLTLT